MANDRTRGNKIPKEYDMTQSPDTVVDPGPYIGTVKSVGDTARSGRLRVWIPEFGGEESNPDSWATVKYASPFAGKTRTPGDDPLSKKSLPDTFINTESTYGFWFVPPDIGNKVLCMFVGGRPDAGYWFACILDSIQHYMIPNNPGSGNSDSIGHVLSASLQQGVNVAGVDANLPLGEVNRYNPTNVVNPFGDGARQLRRPVHPFQAARYIAQGLDRDRIRGPSQASSQRESPSGVFGVSTPGRPADDLKDDINFRTTGRATSGTREIYSRKGGHVFLMDDGDIVGRGEQIRLRSAGGHGIIMDDETGVLYINQADGNAWVELAPSGQIHIYGKAGLNIRSGGDINMHSDGQIKMFAKGEIKMKAEKSVRIEGEKFGLSALELKLSGSSKVEVLSKQGPINLDAKSYIHMKSGGDVVMKPTGELKVNTGNALILPLKPPKGLTTYSHADTIPKGGSWIARDREIRRSVCNIVPCHEPWDRQSGVRDEVGAFDDPLDAPVDINTSDLPGVVRTQDTTQGNGDGAGPATKAGTGGTISTYVEAAPAGRWIISDITIEKAQGLFSGVSTGIGSMTPEDTRVWLAGLFSKESSGQWNNTRNPAYMGGFQIGVAALVDTGYLKADALGAGRGAFEFGGEQYWTGKDGMSSLKTFLDSPGVQTQVAIRLAQSNYQQGIRQGVLTKDSSADQVAGFLAGAHLLGATGASNYINFGSASPTRIYDANGVGYNQYHNMMSDAVIRGRQINVAPPTRTNQLDQ